MQNTKDNPPCNTLFIGNLGENINEEELRGLFSVYVCLISSSDVYLLPIFNFVHNFLSCRQPGFKQMKILRQERHTVCFIEFEVSNFHTTACALWSLNLRLISFFCFYLMIYNWKWCFASLMQDVNSATNVHHSLQGAVIPSSGSVGMRIQYPLTHLFCFWI